MKQIHCLLTKLLFKLIHCGEKLSAPRNACEKPNTDHFFSLNEFTFAISSCRSQLVYEFKTIMTTSFGEFSPIIMCILWQSTVIQFTSANEIFNCKTKRSSTDQGFHR